MKYEQWISYRYLTASKTRFLKFLNVISIAGVAIGVAALIVVTAVMTGFGHNLQEKIIGTTPHLMVEKETGVNDYDKVVSKIEEVAGVRAASPYIQGNVFLEQSGKAMGLVLRGVVPETEKKITKVKEYLTEGKWENLQDNSICIGSELAGYFGYRVGDEITVISPGSGISGQSWRYKLKIVGIFTTGMADFDMNLALVNITTGQKIFGAAANYASGIGVKTSDPKQADRIKKAIYEKIGYSFLVRTWIDMNRSLFEALFLEKWGLFIVLTLMVLVASFNIISTLVVTVSSKIHDIGILQSIGLSQASIRRIFTKQGLWIGFLGTFWGLVSGFGICYFLRHYIKVPAQIYSIDHVPVEVKMTDVAAIIIAAVIISFIATIYPAAKAAKLQPVEALRYE
ncbi:MAG: ABC transporter permease [Candidatus Omnitrophica bacterium]|nr:ABC transporter permease [Candidatus Omnitrophota bacterium]